MSATAGGKSKANNESAAKAKPNNEPAGKSKVGKGNPPQPELSLKQSKSMRKAQNAEAEAERLKYLSKMERMSTSDDELASGVVIQNAKNKESELGSGKGFRDAFGNTMAASADKNKETSRLLERQRAEARSRREAKFAAEAEAAAMKESSGGKSKAAVSMTRQEELESIQSRAKNNEALSSKDLKFLRKHEQEVSSDAAMAAEYATGLSNYSLSIGGKGITTPSDDESEVNISKTLSARDIIVPNFSISAPHRTLFSDATLRLVAGRRYGLLAPNGRGKSTLLKFIAARRLPIPPSISILMLDQEILASEESVVEQVLSADTQRSKLFAEQKQLLSLLDSDADQEATSGSDSSSQDHPTDGNNPSMQINGTNNILSDSELAATVERLQIIGDELNSIGAYHSEAKVCRILTGLGFTFKMQNASSMHLSGGWRVRLSLARALFMEPILLLLDEPTNHLDLDAVLWLDNYLSQEWKGTVLIVSHDCDFLDSVCTDIMNVDETKINYYSGNVTNFEKMKHQITAKKVKDYKLQKKTVKEFEGKGMNLEKAIKRTQEKLELSSLLGEEPREYRVNFNFKSAEDDTPTISVLDATFSYDKNSPPLFSGLRFGCSTSSKIAIVGPNGAGKSTLLRLLTGRLQPTEGVISLHSGLRLGMYDQHFEDLLPHNMTPIKYLCSQFESVTVLEARKYLGMFGLDGARHLINISELSGGQKSRVVFASLALKRPHILILDEPTNHLDLESVDALTRALKEFKGGVILVSHDARLITATECEIWVCEGGLEGGDGIFGTGLRVERRGFQFYRIDVIRQIAKKIEKAEKLVLVKALKRKDDREKKVILAAAAVQRAKAPKSVFNLSSIS